MRQKMYSRKLRQFRYRSKQINRLVENGKFELLAQSKKQQLIAKLRSLYQSLAPVFGKRKLRPMLAGVAIALGLAVNPLQAQDFAPPALNPYMVLPVGDNLNFPAAADIDNDGDTDILVVSLPYSIFPGTFYYYENTGTDIAPNFSEPVANPFGLVPGYAEIAPTFGDIDNDGDLDLFVGEGYPAGFGFFENIGTPEAPDFAAAEFNAFGLTPLEYYVFPSLTDIDSDGDLDMLAADGYAGIHYFENIGTLEEPDFDTPIFNPFGIQEADGIMIPTFTDFDNDGDQDLLYGDYNYGGGFLGYQENIGSPTDPDFGGILQNPFGLNTYGYIALPTTFDMDGDGDLDIFGGIQYYGQYMYFENVAVWPEAADSEVTVDEDNEYIFQESNFNFDNSGGDVLAAIRIETLPQVGTLNYNGSPANPLQLIFPDELGSLSYTPLPGEFGAPYDSFTFKVLDLDGEYNIGAYNMTINVLEVSATSEIPAGLSINMFPNPASTELTVDFSFESTPADVRLEIVDIFGRTLQTRSLSGQLNMLETLSLNGLSAGNYLLRLTADDKVATLGFSKL